MIKIWALAAGPPYPAGLLQIPYLSPSPARLLYKVVLNHSTEPKVAFSYLRPRPHFNPRSATAPHKYCLAPLSKVHKNSGMLQLPHCSILLRICHVPLIFGCFSAAVEKCLQPLQGGSQSHEVFFLAACLCKQTKFAWSFWKFQKCEAFHIGWLWISHNFRSLWKLCES